VTKLLDGEDVFRANGFPLVEFDRKPYDSYLSWGFVLHSDDHFTLMHVVENQTYSLNGYTLFLNHTVKRWRCMGPQKFRSRAVQYRRLRPTLPAGLQLGSWRDAIASAGESSPLLTVHREGAAKNTCWIGRLTKVTQRSLIIHEITPDATWDKQHVHKFAEITLVGFGGVYETLLDKLAPPFLSPTKPRR